MFSHHAFVFRIDKNSITPVLFAQSVTIFALSVLTGQSTLHFLASDDVGTSWLVHRALTRLCQQQSVYTVSQLELELRRTSLLLQLSLQLFCLGPNWI